MSAKWVIRIAAFKTCQQGFGALPVALHLGRMAGIKQSLRGYAGGGQAIINGQPQVDGSLGVARLLGRFSLLVKAGSNALAQLASAGLGALGVQCQRLPVSGLGAGVVGQIKTGMTQG